MTVEEIYALPVDSYGWRKLLTGNYVTLGDCVKLGNYVTLGNCVTLGDGVKLGNSVTLGDGVKLGDCVKLGNYVTLGNCVKLGNYVTLGDCVKLGNSVTLGDGVKLGDGVTLGDDGLDYKWSPLQIQGSRHLLYVAGPNIIGIGCMRHNAQWWNEHYKSTGRAEGYTDEQVAEYRAWLDVAIDWQKKLTAKEATV